MMGKGLGQRITEARTANIERQTKRAQRIADPPRRRHFLMQHNQNRKGTGGPIWMLLSHESKNTGNDRVSAIRERP